MRKIIIVMLVIFSIIPLFISTYLNIFNYGFYRGAFERYRVYEKYDKVDLDKYNKEVLDYLRGSRDDIPKTIFLNESELSHMRDVKELFSVFLLAFRMILVMGMIMLIAIIYFCNRKEIAVILKYSGMLSIAVSLLSLLMFYFNFNFAFATFHKIFFKGDSWLFSASDNIVNIYPAKLFLDISVRIFSWVIIISLLLILTGILIGRKKPSLLPEQ